MAKVFYWVSLKLWVRKIMVQTCSGCSKKRYSNFYVCFEVISGPLAPASDSPKPSRLLCQAVFFLRLVSLRSSAKWQSFVKQKKHWSFWGGDDKAALGSRYEIRLRMDPEVRSPFRFDFPSVSSGICLAVFGPLNLPFRGKCPWKWTG